MADTWTLRETSFDPDRNLAYEGLFTQGSGYLHVRGSLEEHLPDSPQNATYLRMPGNVTVEAFARQKTRWGAFIPGVFGNHPFFKKEMVNLPFFLDLRVSADKEALDMEKSSISGYLRELHLKTGELIRSFTWQTASGKAIKVRFSRFISASRKQLCCQRLSLESASPITIEIRGGINADVRTSGFDHIAETAFKAHGADGIACGVTTDAGDTVETITRFIAPVVAWKLSKEGRSAELKGVAKVIPGKALVIEKRTALSTSRDLEALPAAKILDTELPYEELLIEHAKVWEARWKASDVVVEGDEAAQLALRASIYHLLRCHVPGDARVSVDAKGYAGDAYFGHFFWDTEMYLLPFYLYTDPARARTFTDFRIQSLPGAKRNAAEYGYKGARFAWESDSAGDESCAKGNWQYRDHEIHITGDVAYGLAHYAAATGEKGYLKEQAAELLVETARYWTERADRRMGDDFPSLLGVMGPDEYTPISHNNSYTNRMAKLNLTLAAESGKAKPKERKAFLETANGLPLPRKGKLVLQCEDFNLLADPDFTRRWKDRSKPFAAQVSQEVLYRSKCSKQADVLMLMLLYPNEFTREEMALAWEAYVPFCTHDSSLSAGAHALMAIRLGLEKEAWDFWQKTGAMDIDVENGGAGQGIHIANAGATWMVAVMGFGGMRSAMETETFTLAPELPVLWTKLSFPVVWQGTPLAVEIRPGDARITNRGEKSVRVSVRGREKEVAPGETGAFTL